MKRILIVEDDVNMQELHRATLADQHTVTVTGNVEDALELLEQTDFDVVVTDLRLRGGRKSGVELADTIRSNPGLRHLKLIACTAYRLPDQDPDSPADRFDAVVQKPFLPETIRAAIDRVTDRGRRPD
jgi:CheY-like chemotaxis protein